MTNCYIVKHFYNELLINHKGRGLYYSKGNMKLVIWCGISGNGFVGCKKVVPQVLTFENYILYEIACDSYTRKLIFLSNFTVFTNFTLQRTIIFIIKVFILILNAVCTQKLHIK